MVYEVFRVISTYRKPLSWPLQGVDGGRIRLERAVRRGIRGPTRGMTGSRACCRIHKRVARSLIGAGILRKLAAKMMGRTTIGRAMQGLSRREKKPQPETEPEQAGLEFIMQQKKQIILADAMRLSGACLLQSSLLACFACWLVSSSCVLRGVSSSSETCNC